VGKVGYYQDMSDTKVTTTLDANREGDTLLRRHWQVDEPNAAVLGVHGINEHSGRYEHVGLHFANAGFDTLFFDQRGHGQSAGRRGYIESYEQFYDDIEDLLEQRRKLGVPVVLFGHSMGGLIVASYLLADRPKPDLVVLSAPALDSSHSKNDRRLAKLMDKIAPKVFVKRESDPEILSSDSTVLELWGSDPLIIRGTTGALAMNSFRAMQHLSGNLKNLTLPTYVFHGEADALIPVSTTKPLGDLPNVTYRRWPKMRHECFNEPGREEVLTEVCNWIASQVSVVGSPPS